MKRQFSVILKETNQGWIAFAKDLPGANTQGKTKKEALENIADAIQLLLETYHDDLKKQFLQGKFEQDNIALQLA